MHCPYEHPCCDTKVETVGDGIHCTNECACDFLEKIEALERENASLRSCDVDNSKWGIFKKTFNTFWTGFFTAALLYTLAFLIAKHDLITYYSH